MIYAKWLEIIALLLPLLVGLACLRIRVVYRIPSGILAVCLLLLGGVLCLSDVESRQMLFKNNNSGTNTETLSPFWRPFDNVNMVADGCCAYYPGVEDGDTLLIMASRHDYRANVEFLLSRGADRNIRNKRGDTALDAARRNGHKEICRILEAS